MTHYAINEYRDELLAVWSAGYGETARAVSTLPTTATPTQRFALAESLTHLSRAFWHCYTHPASACRSVEVNTEGWRRQETRALFSAVVASLLKPNLPEGDTLIVSYDPVEESAHRVGRALHEIGDDDLTAAVAIDVEAELAAVEQAERGDLSDRARQAVLLTREDVSPAQIAAADHLLRQYPLGTDDLLLSFDPTAASVAAAHWLQAAADVVADLAHLPAAEVVERADDVEAIPHATPTKILELMEIGASPRDAVLDLISGAMRVAQGELPDIEETRDVIEAADRFMETDEPMRLTPLDPQRPARDLLEDLLAGIRGCWLLYPRYLDGVQPHHDDELQGGIDAEFLDAVRTRAKADHARLL
ncbi:hypothetical protein [Dactylosporangium sp. NPDC005555]|uniref:hypothetical protein n=1 Tax=Dactylosporangium sp. NPDC005555 TaxID=3154889 RepID=UPI0033A1734C